MTPGRRVFLQNMIARCELKAVIRRAAGTAGDLTIAGVLERMAAADRAELASAPAEPEPVAPVAAAGELITWRSPVFNVDGRFNPFAGTFAEQMHASADACDRLGAPDVAVAYRELAKRGEPPAEAPVRKLAQVRKPARRDHSIWSNTPMPPPEPVAFVAGEQLGMFL